MTIDEHLSPADWALSNWRKQDILQLRANGMTLQEVAEYRGLSYSSCRNAVNRLMKDFGANTFDHAVAMAFRWGLIE